MFKIFPFTRKLNELFCGNVNNLSFTLVVNAKQNIKILYAKEVNKYKQTEDQKLHKRYNQMVKEFYQEASCG